MFWNGFLNGIEKIGGWLFIIVCFCLLLGSVGICVWKLQKHAVAGILVASFCSILFTVPLISSLNILVESRAKGLAISEKRDELKNLKKQIENESLKRENLLLQNENLDKSITIGSLLNEVDLLKNAQISMNSLNKICEVALLETKLKQTDVHKNRITSKKGTIVDRIDNEVLIITTHDINAKYGVDLNKVKVIEGNKNELIVYGIESKYIGSDKNISNNQLSEIREVNYKNGQVTKTSIMNDKESIQKANSYAHKYETQFQERLANGEECSFMDEAVVKLAQNFISVILAPLKKDIVFKSQGKEGVSILDYLNNKIQGKEEEIKDARRKLEM